MEKKNFNHEEGFFCLETVFLFSTNFLLFLAASRVEWQNVEGRGRVTPPDSTFRPTTRFYYKTKRDFFLLFVDNKKRKNQRINLINWWWCSHACCCCCLVSLDMFEKNLFRSLKMRCGFMRKKSTVLRWRPCLFFFLSLKTLYLTKCGYIETD